MKEECDSFKCDSINAKTALSVSIIFKELTRKTLFVLKMR